MKKLFCLFSVTILLMTVIVTCTKPVEGVQLSETSLSLEVGESKMLTATVLPENVADKTVTWASSNVFVASVMPNGLVTALSEGTTTIAATTPDGKKSATCNVNVISSHVEELLTQERGWHLTIATCDPPYQLAGEGPITNLFDGYIYDCELDDLIYFRENKSQILNYGNDICTGQIGKEESLGNWSLSDDDKTLHFYLSYYPGQPVEATILSINETTLKVSILIAEDDGEFSTVRKALAKNGAKTIRNYTFTLTYTRN